ncbi:MAG: pentapeptide repeat-containing protein [Verrucomicrobiota bacterium]
MTNEFDHTIAVQRKEGLPCYGLSFCNAILRASNLEDMQFEQCDFTDSDFERSDFRSSGWRSCKLRSVKIDSSVAAGASFLICELEAIRAQFVDLAGARVENCTAQGAQFDQADFTNATLTDTDFSRSSFVDANLENVSATGASFRGADLRNACLRNADLTDCDLRGADLTGADLDGAILDGADLRGVIGDHEALTAELVGEYGAPALPDSILDLSKTMAPIVQEVITSAGQQGVIDPELAERIFADAPEMPAEDSDSAPHPDTLKAVAAVIGEMGNVSISDLMSTLNSQDNTPPPQIQEMIAKLGQAFSLDENASDDEVLERLMEGLSPTSTTEEEAAEE